MKIRFTSPNGQRGCFWLSLGKFDLTIGFTRATRGADLSYNGRFIFCF